MLYMYCIFQVTCFLQWQYSQGLINKNRERHNDFSNLICHVILIITHDCTNDGQGLSDWTAQAEYVKKMNARKFLHVEYTCLLRILLSRVKYRSIPQKSRAQCIYLRLTAPIH